MASLSNAREVGWYSWDEWHHVRKLLYSYNDTKSQIKGINMVRVWKSRLSHRALPVSVDLTAALVAAYVGNTTCVYGNEYEAQMSSAMAIIRFVNGITDQHQTGLYAQSVQLIADKINIPDWMVDLRHEATHAKLPGFELLKSGLIIALNWLDSNYWEETATKLVDKQNTLAINMTKQVGDYSDNVVDILAIESKANHKSAKEKNKMRQRKVVLLEDTINTILKYCHYGNIKQCIHILLQIGFFVLNEKQLETVGIKIVSCDYELDKSSIDRLIEFSNLWKSMFDKFEISIPAFYELVISELTKLIKKNKTSSVSYIIAMFVIFKCNKVFAKSMLGSLLKSPSLLSFQIMKVIIEETEFSDNLRKKLVLFQDIFKPVLNALRGKCIPFDSSKLDVLGTEAALRGKEIINNFQEASGKFSKSQQDIPKSYSQPSSIFCLPAMGEFSSKDKLFLLDMDNQCGDGTYEKNIDDNTMVFTEDNDLTDDNKLKEVIDNLFLDDNDYAGGNEVSPSTTNEYRCDDDTVWDEDVDFNIQDKDDIKYDIGSNFFFSHSKNITDCDPSKVVFF